MVQEQTSVPSATGRAFSLHGAKVCKWPIATLPQEFVSAMPLKAANPTRRE
jgi:hypothetical protein